MALWQYSYCTLEYFNAQFLGYSKVMKLQGDETSFDPKGSFNQLYYYLSNLNCQNFHVFEALGILC